MSIEDVAQKVNSYNTTYVCLTGGEPLEQPEEVFQFCERMQQMCISVLLETSGCYRIGAFLEFEDILIDCDVKPPSADAKIPFHPDNLEHLNSKKVYLKFVISTWEDYYWMKEWLKINHPTCQVWLQADFKGKVTPKLLAEQIMKDGLSGVRIGIQLHKLLWGDKRGV